MKRNDSLIGFFLLNGHLFTPVADRCPNGGSSDIMSAIRICTTSGRSRVREIIVGTSVKAPSLLRCFRQEVMVPEL